MEIMNKTLSPELYTMLTNWIEEDTINYEHDMEYNNAWNALIEYLIELEEGYKPIYDMDN